MQKELNLFIELAEQLLSEDDKKPVANPISTAQLYQQLDLSLNEEGRTVFFHALIEQHYPHIEPGANEYLELQMHYRSCWMTEKIYRNKDHLSFS